VVIRCGHEFTVNHGISIFFSRHAHVATPLQSMQGMMAIKPSNGNSAEVHAGSWGMLVVSRNSARFLWFDDPRELLCAVLEVVSPSGGNRPARWKNFAGVHGVADEEERLHAFLMLEGLVKEINRREHEFKFRVNWWGPLTDLQDNEAAVPTMIRAWFRRRRCASQNHEEPLDGSIDSEHLPVFAEFLDRVSFGAEDLGEA